MFRGHFYFNIGTMTRLVWSPVIGCLLLSQFLLKEVATFLKRINLRLTTSESYSQLTLLSDSLSLFLDVRLLLAAEVRIVLALSETLRAKPRCSN